MSIAWTITTNAAAGTARFQSTSVGVTHLDLTRVYAGDYVNIGGTLLNEANRGSFPIIDTSVYIDPASGNLVQYFEIQNEEAVAEVVTVPDTDVLFFRPSRASIHLSDSRSIILAQTEPGEIDVVIPATTQVVGRTSDNASYAQVGTLPNVTSVVRNSHGSVTVTFATNPELAVGQIVRLDDVYPKTTVPATSAGTSSTTDASPVSIVSTLSAATVRPDSAAVKLLNDDILVIGGFGNTAARFRITSTTVLADGSTRYGYSWPATAAMVYSRARHTATLLNHSLVSGKVLVYGGWNNFDGTKNDGEIYDPSANTWASIAGGAAREQHTASELADGRVLLAGGYAVSNLATCDMYDPTTGAITSTGPLNAARAGHQAVTLSDGRVLVVGGGTNSCELFDPSTNTWAKTGNMTFIRSKHQIVLLPNDRVLVVGGEGGNASYGGVAPLSSAEVWDSRTGCWNPTDSISTARLDHSLVYIPSVNRVLVWGGATLRTQLWNPDTGRWENCIAQTPTSTADRISIAIGGAVFKGTHLLTLGSNAIGSGRVNGEWRVASINGNSISFSAPENLQYFDAAEVGTVQPSSSPESDISGPFVFDPIEGAAITGVDTTSTQEIVRGQQYSSLKVADALEFPDEEGYIALNYGTGDAMYPVRYLGRFSEQELILDYSYRFSNDAPTGSKVTLLAKKDAYVPTENVGAFYATASAAGRVAASQAVDAMVAAGITVNKTVKYPGDRGLGGEGLPATGAKISDKVAVWGGDDLDEELAVARGEE